MPDRKPRRLKPGVIRVPLPDVEQNRGFTGGAAALMAVLHYYGIDTGSEKQLVQIMGVKATSGADPVHIRQGARHFEVQCDEFWHMRFSQLIDCLDAGLPVLMMLQARGGPGKDHAASREAGHWVVAIGYDGEVVYFADPDMRGARAYLTYIDLDDRWHDVEGAAEKNVFRYGLALRKPRAKRQPGGKRLTEARWMN